MERIEGASDRAPVIYFLKVDDSLIIDRPPFESSDMPSEEAKVMIALIVAGLMVASIGSVLVIGAENEPDGPELPTDTTILLTYRVTGIIDDVDVEGTFDGSIYLSEVNGLTWGYGFNVTGNIEGLIAFSGPLPQESSQAHYLDDASLETEWGIKQIERTISIPFIMEDGRGFCINYCGAQTGLAYQVIYIAPDARATIDLIDINVLDMGAYDLNPTANADDLIESRHADDYWGMSGPYSSLLIQPRGDEYYSIHINATNSMIIGMDEEDIYNMIGGGEYQYRSGWSVIGNGSTEFIISEGFAFFIGSPTEVPLTDSHLQLNIDVKER